MCGLFGRGQGRVTLAGLQSIPTIERPRSATCNFSINKLKTSLVYDHKGTDRKLHDYFHSDCIMILPFPKPSMSIGLLARLHEHVCALTHLINDDT
jgi:hypothetical protein